MSKKKAIVCLSGGMDSAVVLSHAIHKGVDVRGLYFFHYQSKHNDYEQHAANRLAAYHNLPIRVLNLANFSDHLKSDLLRSGGEIPEGHYEDKSMSRTVVPGRNMVFASMLAGIAWSMECDRVYLGVHAGDHAIYPDCRPKFVRAMRRAIRAATDGRVELKTPFLHDTKADIVKAGLRLKTPFELTRTCYKSQELACGKCGSCRERLEAFSLNNAEDPIRYEGQ